MWEDNLTDEKGRILKRLWKAREKRLQETRKEKGMIKFGRMNEEERMKMKN